MMTMVRMMIKMIMLMIKVAMMTMLNMTAMNINEEGSSPDVFLPLQCD